MNLFPLLVHSWSKLRCRSSSAFRASSAAAASLAFRWISSSFFFPWPKTLVMYPFFGPFTPFPMMAFISQDSSKSGHLFEHPSDHQPVIVHHPNFKNLIHLLQAKDALASAMSFQLTTFYGLGRLPSVHVTLLVVASQLLPAWVRETHLVFGLANVASYDCYKGKHVIYISTVINQRPVIIVHSKYTAKTYDLPATLRDGSKGS